MERIFFLINNNVHLLDARSHFSGLKNAEIHLICVPHTLDPVGAIDGVKQVYRFASPFTGTGSLFKINTVRRCHREISSTVAFSEYDMLVMYTEYEPLNQYIASLVKKAKGKVFILDEGLGTYLTFSQKSDVGMPVKQVVKLLWSKYVLGHWWMKYLYLNNMPFPQMRDDLLDGLISYKQFNCVRSVPLIKIDKPSVKQVDLDENACLFLNSDIYNFYTSWNCYINELVAIMHHLCKHFEVVHFKFHPREPDDVREKVIQALSGFENMKMVSGMQPVETTFELIRARYAVSYISTSLLNLVEFGVQVVYIFHLMPSTCNCKVSTSLAAVFQSMGITLVESLDHVLPGKTYCVSNSGPEDVRTLATAVGL